MSRFDYIIIPNPSQRQIALFWSHVAVGASDECWPCLNSPSAGGYCRFGVYLAHRYAYTIFNGPIPSGLDILHSCDSPVCCNPSHLSAGTHADNMADRDMKGRMVANCGGAKLAKGDVVTIRELYVTGRLTQCDLADQFGVSQANIDRIVRGRIWKDVGGPLVQKGHRRAERGSVAMVGAGR